MDEERISRDELTSRCLRFRTSATTSAKFAIGLWRTTMAKPRKRTPEERDERIKREREFTELLEKRKALDEKLAAERKQREAS